MPTGDRIDESMASGTPCPHQVRAFHRLHDPWPPNLLSADEVGFGKTIQAGRLPRQPLLVGRSKWIPILTLRAVIWLRQIKLRENCNLNWPNYNGITHLVPIAAPAG